MSYKGIIDVPIPFDFSFGAVNFMIKMARENDLGKIIEFEFEEGKNVNSGLYTWYLVCERGKVRSHWTK